MITSLNTCDEIASELEDRPTLERRLELLRKLVDTHEVFSMELGTGSVFWRAQNCPANGFPLESRMSYPPVHLAGPNRFNNAQEPALYVATRRETAMAEIGVEPNSYVQLSGFRILNGEALGIILIGEWMHIHKKGYMRIGDKAASRAVSASINSFPLHEARLFTYIDAILGDVMARADAAHEEYLSTRLLARLLYEKLPDTEGILYPSVRDPLGTNLAIRASAADRAVRMCSSMVVRVGATRRHNFYDYEPVKVAIGTELDGSFKWVEPSRPDQIVLYGLSAQEAANPPASLIELTDPRYSVQR